MFVVSDSLKSLPGELSVSVIDFAGNVVFNEVKKVTVGANCSKLYFAKEISEILSGRRASEVFVKAVLTTKDNKSFASRNYFLETFKNVNLPKADISWASEARDGGISLTLESSVFARGVFLSIDGVDNFFSDNYFDLLPHEKKIVFVRTNLSKDEFDRQLKLRSL